MTKLKFKREYIAQEYTYDENYSNCKLIKEGEPIVRCSRCKSWTPNPLYYGVGKCSFFKGATRTRDDFCSDGDDEK